ncbi:hypothetical protein ACFYZ9_19855 [Streptomyces sp. NPDC001691]|uniref:hypothetical protein n=1 Tax=Streptomyces sp. NPDC001691 TaxID=3364600 RepID=UPI003677052D
MQSSSEVQAFALAAKLGHRVEIIDRREEYAETYANPDGTLTRHQSTTPVWTRYDRTWRKADATVVAHPDGTVGPAAPVFGITFSGGGTTPLATMTKGDKQLALSWPAALPKPVLDGSTALYKSVLPDVDLKVIAGTDGFAEHLIVNTPQAAANPAVKSIKLGVSTKGVTLADDAGDNLTAKDASGNVVFSAPRPKMWEQPPTGAGPAASGAPAAKSFARSTASAAPQPPRSAPVGVDVSAGALTLTPDPALLAGASQFPLVIDPPFTGGVREKWAVVYSDTAGESYPNGSGWHSDMPADEARVGNNGTGDTRSFFAMNTNGLQGATILDATFSLEETHSWGCDPAAAGWTELWTATDISNTPTWNSQGSYWGHVLASDSYAHGNPTYCPGVQGHDYHSAALTSYVQEAASKGWDPLVFGLRTDDGHLGDHNSFKRFKQNPALEVTYNFKPTVDSSAAFEGNWAPGADGNKQVPCNGVIGNSGLAMTAKVTDKDGGKVTAIFKVNNAAGQDVPFPTNWQTVWTGSTATATVPTKNLTSGTYSWRVYAQDDENTVSPATSWCSFTVDQQGPTDPVKVTTPDGKAANDPTVTFQARTSAKLTLYNSADDVAGFCWATDHYLSVSNTRCYDGTWTDVGPDKHSATINALPASYPNSKLYVLAYDKAGNHSPMDGAIDTVQLSTSKAAFVYGPGKDPGQGLSVRDLPGDLNGDGYPDMLATDTTGKLSLYPGNGTGAVGDPVTVGLGGWNGALIAHGGDFVGMNGTDAPDGYEDYLVKLNSGKLFLYPGNGQGTPWFWNRRELARPSSATGPGAAFQDWSGLQQIIAPGDIDQNNAPGYAGGNDLITIECADTKCTNAELWLYRGKTVGAGDKTRADQTEPFDINGDPANGQGRVKLGSAWQGFTNLAVGDQNGDGIKDLLARDPADGKLYLYPGKLTNGVFSLGDRSVYGSAGWAPADRPHLASAGNVQGTVVNSTYSDPDSGTNITYQQFQPKTGDEYGDFWATTPANSSYNVNYVDDTGAAKTTTSSTGCLLFYAGGKTMGRDPRLLGCGGWSSYITNIF